MKHKILIFTEYYLPGVKGGGPIKTIHNLVNSTKDVVNYSIITSDRDLGDNFPYKNVLLSKWNGEDGYQVFYNASGLKNIINSFSIIKQDDFDLIYLNSMFSFKYSIIPLVISKLFFKNVVLSPRGELSKGALEIKSVKKIFFLYFFKLLNFHKNLLFQASSVYEANDISNVFGNKVNIFIAENIAAKKFAKNIQFKDNGVLKIVSLSRISKIKNILYSLNLLKNIKFNVVFDIYGPIEDDLYWHECLDVINKNPENVTVNYKGLLESSKVIDTLSNYDLFLMPTKGENYGHAIVESLCAGLPVLIADTTPWKKLEEKGIGWDLPLNDPECFVNIINFIADMSIENHYKMREFILDWAKSEFSQNGAIDQNLSMFHSIVKNK